MKKIALLIILITGALSVGAQTPVTNVSFDKLVWDFGTIREQDGEVTHKFSYKNIGSKPLIITAINTSCGCTTPGYNKAPLMPGQTAVLTIKFDPTNQIGRVEKSIIVRANVPEGSVGLKIRGLVTPRPRTVEDDYPVELTDGVRVTDIVVDAGNIPNTRETTQALGFLNTSTKSAEVFFSNVDHLPTWITIAPRKLTLAPGQKGVVTFALRPSGDMWGLRNVPIAATVNGRIQYTDVVLSALLVEDFSNLVKGAPAPRVRIDGIFYHFSTVKKGDVLKRSFKLFNSGTAELAVRALDCSDGVRAAISKRSVAPGEEVALEVTMDSGVKGAASGVVRIVTNDPVRPVLAVRLLANVE